VQCIVVTDSGRLPMDKIKMAVKIDYSRSIIKNVVNECYNNPQPRSLDCGV
jgi:hypothetical protein